MEIGKLPKLPLLKKLWTTYLEENFENQNLVNAVELLSEAGCKEDQENDLDDVLKDD